MLLPEVYCLHTTGPTWKAAESMLIAVRFDIKRRIIEPFPCFKNASYIVSRVPSVAQITTSPPNTMACENNRPSKKKMKEAENPKTTPINSEVGDAVNGVILRYIRLKVIRADAPADKKDPTNPTNIMMSFTLSGLDPLKSTLSS